MKVNLKPWQDKDKTVIQNTNNTLARKEVSVVNIDVQGEKYLLMETKGGLLIMTPNGERLVIEPSTVNSFIVRHKND